MAYDEHQADRIRQAFLELHSFALEKRMMGGICFMVNDKMCAGLINDTLLARIGPDIYDEALTQPGCREMTLTGRPMRGFVLVDAEELDADADLLRWIKLCLDYNPLARSAKTRRKPQGE